MALIKSVRGFTPKIGKNTFLADNATIVGDVEIGEGCSIWFNAVLRGDVNSLRIGNGARPYWTMPSSARGRSSRREPSS